jgi:hypothetical protein
MNIKFFVDKLPRHDNWAGAVAAGPIIWIKKTQRNNLGLIAHEEFHVKIFWLWALFFLGLACVFFWLVVIPDIAYFMIGCAIGFRALLYMSIPKYRLWEEIKAYAIQHRINGGGEARLVSYARTIATRYRLNISESEVLEKLKDELRSD